jgi:hypothetical protein
MSGGRAGIGELCIVADRLDELEIAARRSIDKEP